MRNALDATALVTGGLVLLAVLVLILRPRRPGYSMYLTLVMKRDREREHGEKGPDQRSDP